MKTITLPLEEYNHLLEYEKAINEKKATLAIRYGAYATHFYRFLDNNETSESLSEEIKNLQEEISRLKNELTDCRLNEREFNFLPWYKKMNYEFNTRNIEDVLLNSVI